MQCLTSQRLADLRARGGNGIDSVEVSGDGLELLVTFFGDRPELQKQMIRISGGVRVREIHVVDLRTDDEDGNDLVDAVRIFVDRRGDRSTYTLALVELDREGRPTERPLPGLDRRYRQAEFAWSRSSAETGDAAVPPLLLDAAATYAYAADEKHCGKMAKKTSWNTS